MIPKPPTVSAVITTYNRAAFVVQALESVFCQTWADREVIVVDDGSNDGTGELLESYSGKIRFVRQENRGPSAARNHGIELSRGEFVAFLDSDDLWLPEKCTRQVGFMREHPDLPLCYTDEIWIRNGKRVNQGRRHRKYHGDIFPFVLPLCIISPSSALMRRRLFSRVGTFDESLPACEDYDLWLRIASRYPVGFLPEPLIVKRGGHPDQLSRTVEALDRYRIRALEKLIRAGELEAGQRRLALDELRRKCRVYGNGCLRRGRKEEGERILTLPDRLSESEGEGKAPGGSVRP